MSTKAKTVEMTDEQMKAGFERFDSIIRNNGYDPESKKRLSMTDALDIPNAAFFIPRIMTMIVQEGIEPMLIGTSLLQRIEYAPGLTTVFPAIDVLTAREAADGGSLPTFNINVGGAVTQGLSVKRHGLQLRINERFLEQSTYPWMQYWLKLASNALGRHKEENIFNFLTKLGTKVFDNDPNMRKPTTPANLQPVKGTTTGRNVKGQYNGSMVVDDVFDLYAQVLMQGFIPDTMLVHPMTWLMWVKDPVMREFAIQAGGGSFFANWTGNAAAQANKFYNFNGLGAGVGQTGKYSQGVLAGGQTNTPEGLPQNQTSAPILPTYLGLPFKILVSPFVRYVPATRVTDVLMFNSSNLGALVVAKDPHVREWNDPQWDILNLGIEEEYGLAIINEGQAIATAKNVKIRPNEFVLPARSIIDIGASTTFQEYGVDSLSAFGANPADVNSVS